MNICNIYGCKYLQTTCVTCGRLVMEKIVPRCVDWVNMREHEPIEDGEILLISECTDERIGTVCLDQKVVLLEIRSLKFDDIDWWMAIPEVPK